MTEPYTPNSTGGHASAQPEPLAATPAWRVTAARPLEVVLTDSGHGPGGKAATLWPLGQRSDLGARVGRYVPDTLRHPSRSRVALMAQIIARHSSPGQIVFDGFAGSGTTLVEAAYAGRRAIGVESDVRWFDLCLRNLLYARNHGATDEAFVAWADTRHLMPFPRRLRHRVDLVVTTPPLQLGPVNTDRGDDTSVFIELERDMRAAISSWIPLLHPGSTLVFTSRLQPANGYLLDPSVPIAAAAHRCGLQLLDRAAALRVPVREAFASRRTPAPRHAPRRPRVIHDDVLIYQVPGATLRWRRAG